MPYNTRRKSLSLPSLGIQLPQSSRSHPSPPTSAKGEQPPQKRLKRDCSPVLFAHKPIRFDPTPPPSPPPEWCINYAETNDKIVSGVVGILERTGNRPHTVKELAVSLAPHINLIENSTNPHAIISSRLNAYLKRGSNPSLSCVLKKELITTHPRRIYFYLTTCPHQPIPKHEHDIAGWCNVVSPAPSDEEDDDMRKRSQLSPSPEIDLSTYELDDGNSTSSEDSLTSTTANMIARQRKRSPISLAQKHALVSAPLEGDEREFSQSAIYIERRSAMVDKDYEIDSKRTREEYESDDAVNEDRNFDEAAAALLGYSSSVSSVATFSSPALVTTTSKQDLEKIPLKINSPPHHISSAELYSWGGEFERHLGSPESVELEELDHLLGF
jgi:hypothetical protein